MEERYLFRAKRIDNGEWAQGYYYQIWGSGYILWGVTNNLPNMIKVDVSTICQCTGLKDKNGKLIWENDIVGHKYGKSVVVWDRSEWRVRWIAGDIWRRDLHYWVTEDDSEVEVVGNAFDNPELLEVQE